MKLINASVAALLLTSARAFAPPIPLRTHGVVPEQRSFPRFFYQNEDNNMGAGERSPMILPRVDQDNNKIELAFSDPAPDIQPPKLVLPSTAVLKEPKQYTTTTFDWTKLRKTLHRWRNRPGVRFRIWLGTATAVAFAIASLALPRGFSLAQTWISHRGFQGISALGRTVAYVWALLVAYPRLLDKRSNERQRQRKEEALQRRRTQLDRLAAEVARWRQEVAGLDAEIRAFRREIISLKAYAKEDGEEIQAAIHQEMAHLNQLRSDAQAALSAARQSWAEYRSTSPPEIWDDTLMP